MAQCQNSDICVCEFFCSVFNEATCTKEGNIEYWSCFECGKNYDSENGGNILDNVSPCKIMAQCQNSDICVCEFFCSVFICEISAAIKDATCMKDGTETAVCDFCDETNTRAAAGSKHNHTMEVFYLSPCRLN